MKPKRLALAASPLLISSLALWQVGKYHPKTIEIEGVGSQIALRALAKACVDYPLARQITVHRTRLDSLTDHEKLTYNRHEHRFLWDQPLAVTTVLSNVGEDDARALSDVRPASTDDYEINNETVNFLIRRGCKVGNS